MLLVSFVHQFIWPTFNWVVTRNGIFKYRPDWPRPFLTMPSKKSFDQLLIFVNQYQHAKNQLIPFVHSSDKFNFKVPSHDWQHPVLTIPTPKTFKLIFMKFDQHAKNKLVPLVISILESSNQIGHINMLKMRLFNQFSQRYRVQCWSYQRLLHHSHHAKNQLNS